MKKANSRNFRLKFNKNYFFSLFFISLFLPGMIGSVMVLNNEKSNNILVIGSNNNSNNKNTPSSSSFQTSTTNTGVPINSKISASGLDPADAIPISMNNGNVTILQIGSILGTVNYTNSYIFYEYTLNSTGPVDVSVSSPILSDIFQLTIDVFTDVNGVPVGSSYNGNPVTLSYAAQNPGINYVAVGGFDMNPSDNFDIFSYGSQVPFNLTVSLHKQGIVTAGSVSALFQSDAYQKVSNIFSFFRNTGYINITTDTVDLLRGTNDPATYLDPTDTDYYKGIGLSIYGIVRACDFLSSSNKLSIIDKTLLMTQYLNYAIQLFSQANQTSNIGTNGADAVYVRPPVTTTAYLSDNAYMLWGASEIVYFAERNPVFYSDVFVNSFPVSGPSYYSGLANWTYKLEKSIYDVFQSTPGVYPEIVTGLGTSLGHGDLVYLESLSILAEDFDEVYYNYNATGSYLGINTLVPPINSWPDSQINGYGPNNVTIIENIEKTITNHLLVTNNINITVNLITGTDIGLGVEYYNTTDNKISNVATLMGNIAYAQHLTSHYDNFSFGGSENYHYVNATYITENMLRLFTVPGTNLLQNRAVLINNGTTVSIPIRISTIGNAEFTLLAQRLQIKWNDYSNNTDVSRAWGKKAFDSYNALVNLMYDNIDNAFFTLYDYQGQVFETDDNNILSNRFVANAFINSVLVRIFPVQLGVIAGNNVPVGNSAQLSLEFSQIPEYDSVNWYDFLIPFTFQLQVAIPQFFYSSIQTINLADFANFSLNAISSSEFINQLYKPTVKGNYTIYITLSEEGQPLLSHQITLTALGQITADYIQSDLVFSTDQSIFTARFTLIDDAGNAIPNLNVNSSLGISLDQASNSNYIKRGRSDASGKVAIIFDVSKLFKDGIINESALLQSNPIPTSITLYLYVNVTNALTQNLQQATNLLKIPITVVIAQMDARISPSTLQITQGTTDAFTFIITVLNQNQAPVANANITYSITGVSGSTNTVFTNAEGDAVVTFRDSDLFGLSNLALIAEGTTNTTINFQIAQPSYPTKSVQHSITILADSLKITANPVQVDIQQKSFLDPTKQAPVSVEVAVQDSFGKIVPAQVYLAWDDTNLNNNFNLTQLGSHIAPYTFTIDPSNLPVGELDFSIVATMDGITTTHQVSSTTTLMKAKITSTRSNNADVFINRPVVISRKIIIEPSTIQDILVSLIGIMSGLLLAQVISFAKAKGLLLSGQTRVCPFCNETISGSISVCSQCGRDIEPVKKKKTKSDGKGKGLGNQQKVENSQETNSQVDFGVLNTQKADQTTEKTDMQNNSSVDESTK